MTDGAEDDDRATTAGSTSETDIAAGSNATEGDPVLTVENLKTHYPIRDGWLRREVGRVRAVDGVSFELRRGEALGVVGESGSGKSTLARTILQLETATDGEIEFAGTPIDDLDGDERRAFQRRVQLVVQNPDDAFSPRMTVGEAVGEPLRLHGMTDADRRREIVSDLLERVGLSATDADRYPHEFSGGEKQRISIARALVVNPDLIVADEPTSALDSRVRSDVLSLLDRIRREHDVSVLFISHDVDVVRLFCDRLMVMYLGEIVERGPITDVLDEPAHPYTRVLLGSVPSLDPGDRTLERPLTEAVPDPADPPDGCSFHTRCPEVIPPTDVDLSPDTWAAVASFRFSLQTGELPESVANGSRAAASIRDRFGVPDPVPDDDVERAVDDAITSLVDGDHDRAATRLAETASTVCERCSPAAVDYDGRPVACHRYDPEIEADPQPWGDR